MVGAVGIREVLPEVRSEALEGRFRSKVCSRVDSDV